MLGSMAMLASPEVLLKLMHCWKLLICTPPPDSTTSSAPLGEASCLRSRPRRALTAICSSSGLRTCTPLLPSDKLRKGRLASGASAPLTLKVSSTRSPLVPPGW